MTAVWVAHRDKSRVILVLYCQLSVRTRHLHRTPSGEALMERSGQYNLMLELRCEQRNIDWIVGVFHHICCVCN